MTTIPACTSQRAPDTMTTTRDVVLLSSRAEASGAYTFMIDMTSKCVNMLKDFLTHASHVTGLFIFTVT